MKATGIVRRIDDLGRIIIPKEIRRTYGIKEGDPLEIFTSEEGITVRPYEVDPKQTLRAAINQLERFGSDIREGERLEKLLKENGFLD
jgi:AbrB family looped-hinge helix DNA binding protein